MPNRLTFAIRNDRAEIPRLAQAARQFGERHRLPEDVVFAVDLAIDEVVTNVISYGYADGGEHQIVARLHLTPGELTLEVEDDGKPFDPLRQPPPDLDLSLEDRPIGGLGIHLVRNLMDCVEYRRLHDHNILVMRKRIPPVAV